MGKDLKGKELGTGFRQRNDGTYSVRFIDRFGNRKELYSKKITDLRKRADIAKSDNLTGKNTISNSMTLTEWFTQWMEIHKYKVIRNNTKMYYTQVFSKHIEPTLGAMKLKNITQIDIKHLLKQLDKQGLKYETQNKVRIILLDMFEKALIDNFVSRNPAKGIKLVRDEEKQIRVLTKEEQIQFFDSCKGTFFDNLYIVAINTGLRQGEICALTWKDIDLEKKEISVNKTLLYQKLEGDETKTFHINPPKTKQSKRKIPINKQCELALKKQYIQSNIVKEKTYSKVQHGFENLLFITRNGSPICDQVLIDDITRIVNEINTYKDSIEQFERFTPHCLRHSFACRCFEAEIPPKTVQKYLGHASLQMTMDLYTHVLEDKQQEDMLKLENALDKLSENAESMIETRYKEEMKKANKIVNINVG